MPSFASPLQRDFFWYCVFAVVVLWPAILICRRAGVKQAWAMTLGMPFVGLILFSCALAFQPWQPDRKSVPA